LRNPPGTGHDESPCQLRYGMRGTCTAYHQNTAFCARGNVDVVLTRTCLNYKAEFGQFVDEWAGNAGSLVGEDNHFGISQTNGQLAHAFDVVGVDLGRVGVEQCGAGQLADGVLEIIKNYYIHRPYCACECGASRSVVCEKQLKKSLEVTRGC